MQRSIVQSIDGVQVPVTEIAATCSAGLSNARGALIQPVVEGFYP